MTTETLNKANEIAKKIEHLSRGLEELKGSMHFNSPHPLAEAIESLLTLCPELVPEFREVTITVTANKIAALRAELGAL